MWDGRSIDLTYRDFRNWIHVPTEGNKFWQKHFLGYPLGCRPVILETLSADVKGRGDSIHGTVRVSVYETPVNWECVHGH